MGTQSRRTAFAASPRLNTTYNHTAGRQYKKLTQETTIPTADPNAITPGEFIAKWRASELKERSAAQEHFIDLCRLLGEPTPADADPTGDRYCFERGARRDAGGEGWADVWKRHCFAWEYKGKHANLDAAFNQLRQYALALENPPLLIVSDMARFRIRTNWTNSVSETYEFTLDDLFDAGIRDKLKWAMSDPERLRPGETRQALTERAAATFASLAQSLRWRGHDGQAVAHFVNRLVFCMFAEDMGLLPDDMFTRMLEHARRRPDDFTALARDLFGAMATGGRVGFEEVAWFDGGLFDDDTALPLKKSEIEMTLKASALDWSEIDPSILGTLFERGLDPDKRSQLGAHYTDHDKIMLIVEPVVVRPWLDQWTEVKAEITDSLDRAEAAKSQRMRATQRRQAERSLRDFLDRLRRFTVLDPACGSGNFLYLALRALKDLEHRVQLEAEAMGLPRAFPMIGPANVKGIEINPYAAELARVSVWIGEIQWMRRNGFTGSRDPISKSARHYRVPRRDPRPGRRGAGLAGGRRRDRQPALSRRQAPARRTGRRIHRVLAAPLRLPDSRRGGPGLPLVRQGRPLVADGKIARAGLVATNSIRGGRNRSVLDQIVEHGAIFDAWSDEPWVIDGAAVRVSLVCFTGRDAGLSNALDGAPVTGINADLTAGDLRLAAANRLAHNTNSAFMGDIKNGSFDIRGEKAREWLTLPANPNGRPNSDVLRPWVNGMDLTRRPSGKWIVDFGDRMGPTQAALYEAPFSHVAEFVKPARQRNRAKKVRDFWWRHEARRPNMWNALHGLSRYIATPRVAKHRLFVWLDSRICPDCQLIVIARDDDTTFGILHSRFHEAWSLRLGTSLEDRPRYTPTTTFETFPFPLGLSPDVPAGDYADDPRAIAIAEAARRLVELRDRWLNPPNG